MRLAPIAAGVALSLACATRASVVEEQRRQDEARQREIERETRAEANAAATRAAEEAAAAAELQAAREAFALEEAEREAAREAELAEAHARRQAFEAQQARERAEAQQAVLERAAAHDAWIEEQARTAPPWHCWAFEVVFSDGTTAQDGACFTARKRCESGRRAAGSKYACSTQPLAACFSAKNALTGGGWWCAPTFELCRQNRWSVTGGNVSKDWPEISECERYPTTSFEKASR